MENQTIPTAEDLLEKNVDTQYVLSRNGKEKVLETMIEFAKLHVKAALEAQRATTKTELLKLTKIAELGREEPFQDGFLKALVQARATMDDYNIINAYPESNIK